MLNGVNPLVMHVTTAHPRDDIRIYHKMIKWLANDSVNVQMVVADGLGNSVDSEKLITDVGANKNRLSRFLFTPFKLMRVIFRSKPTFVHFHDPDFILAGYFLSFLGYKIIYDVHEDIPRQILGKKWIASPLRKPISYLFEKAELFLSRRFYSVVGATDKISKRFFDFNENVLTIKNFPILSEFQSLPKNRKNKTLCYIGAISESRGILEILRVLQDLPEYKLVIAGSFESKDLKERVSKLPSWNRVSYLGKVGRKEISEILSESTLGIVTLHPLPNYIESLPIKMFEYMASGLPIVASNFPLWVELVESNGVGLCADPLNPNDIKEKIIQVIKYHDSYSDKGRLLAEENFSWETQYRLLRKLYI